jgi:hypothetical protein
LDIVPSFPRRELFAISDLIQSLLERLGEGKANKK